MTRETELHSASSVSAVFELLQERDELLVQEHIPVGHDHGVGVVGRLFEKNGNMPD